MGWRNSKFENRKPKSEIRELKCLVVFLASACLASCSSAWADGDIGVETEDAAQTWPVPRGPAHDLAPYQYDPSILKTVPKEFLEDAPACILYTSVANLVEPDGTIETITHEIT